MGFMNDINGLVSDADVTLMGDAAIESEITLAAIRNQCASDEEFAQIIQDSAVEMALYGIIEDAEAALEATKKIVIKDYKTANINRLTARCAIRLAQKANSAEYKKYAKYRALYLEARKAIYKKYGAKAKVEAKKIMANSRRKSSNITSSSGKSITEKIDREIQNQANSGKAKKA